MVMEDYILWIVIAVLVFAVITLNSAIGQLRKDLIRVGNSLNQFHARIQALEYPEEETTKPKKRRASNTIML
jgi:hypothetical protein